MAVFEDPVDHWSKAIKVPAWPGNRVTPLIDGEATFKMMYNAIRSALRERDNWGCYIYLLGWYLDLDLPLVENKPETSFFALLQKAAASHVQTRVMLWTGTPWPPNSGIPESEGRSLIGLLSTRKNNRNARDRINSLEYAAAIVDSENLAITGSHHQKVLIVKGHEGLKAFCGGIDINADRVKAVRGQPGSAMHDVHCMIEGDAAHILVDIFVQRWLAHPGHFYFDEADTRPAKNRKKRGGPLLGLTDRKPPAPGQRPVGAQYVGIGRTFNCFFPGSSVGPVGPQPCGDRTIHDMIAGAVGAASRFIYIEEQYLVNFEVARWLAAKLNIPSFRHLTILIPHAEISDHPFVRWARREFFATLIEGKSSEQATKVRIFCRAFQGKTTPHSYIHAKTWVFDDELAIIGSANCNRRGLESDSEVVAAIFDKRASVRAPGFAQKLRIDLWAEHLGMTSESEKLKLRDGAESGDRWLAKNRPSMAKVADYDLLKDGEGQPRPAGAVWSLVDPPLPLRGCTRECLAGRRVPKGVFPPEY